MYLIVQQYAHYQLHFILLYISLGIDNEMDEAREEHTRYLNEALKMAYKITHNQCTPEDCSLIYSWRCRLAPSMKHLMPPEPEFNRAPLREPEEEE